MSKKLKNDNFVSEEAISLVRAISDDTATKEDVEFVQRAIAAYGEGMTLREAVSLVRSFKKNDLEDDKKYMVVDAVRSAIEFDIKAEEESANEDDIDAGEEERNTETEEKTDEVKHKKDDGGEEEEEERNTDTDTDEETPAEGDEEERNTETETPEDAGEEKEERKVNINDRIAEIRKERTQRANSLRTTPSVRGGGRTWTYGQMNQELSGGFRNIKSGRSELTQSLRTTDNVGELIGTLTEMRRSNGVKTS